MSPSDEGRAIRVRCQDCGAEWDVDCEPIACTCPDGGRWQLRVGDGPWMDGAVM